ncbi:MAG: AI-2E family transporter, partial [Gemmatimonadales bacterium]
MLAIAFAAVGIWVARGFLIPLGWSFLVAVALWPLYRRAVTAVPFHWPAYVAPLLFTLATALVLMVPLGLAAVQIGHEGEVAIEWLGRVQDSGLPQPRWLERLPIIGSPIAGWWREHLADPQQLTAVIGDFDRTAMANWTKLVAGKVGRLSFVFFVTVLALFFVFRDGEWLAGRLL